MQYYICLATRYDLISSIYSLRLITQTYKSVPIISEYSSMLQLILLISELILCFKFRRMICMHVDYIRPRAISPCISPRRPECPQIDRECPHNYSARPGILNIDPWPDGAVWCICDGYVQTASICLCLSI